MVVMERSNGMILFSAILLYLENSIPPQVEACSNTDIQLVGGRNNLEGRVEVCYQGQWGTVCDDFWDTRDAMVACRQLGLNPDYAAKLNSVYSIIGQGTGSIFLDNVNCRGNETSLDDCPHNGVGNHDCIHREDAGVICPQAAVCNNTDIRLAGGSNNFEGRVEVCLQGQWGTVCDDSWDARDAMVACRQLGLNPNYAAAITADSNIFGPGTGPIFFDDVRCRGNETRLDDCPHDDGGSKHNCYHLQDAGVICPQACNNTAIRLVGGRNDMEGRVEVCFQRQWGTVCNNSWNTKDAAVACRQLGLTSENVEVDRNFFGPGVGPIFLDNVSCRGSETKLANCNHNGVGNHSCSHLQDAGVICQQAPESTSSQVSASVIGSSVGGALIVIIILQVLIIIAAVVVRRKKAAVQSFREGAIFKKTEDSSYIRSIIKDRPKTNQTSKWQRTYPHNLNLEDPTHIESEGKDDSTAKVEETLTVPNPYNRHSPASPQCSNASTGTTHLVGSNYIRKLSEQMIISEGNIKLLKCIGQGEFGIVYKAQLTEMGTHPSVQVVAVKTLKGFFDRNEVNTIMEESLKMKQFNHPNVMNLIGVCMDAGPAPYIVMPFMANGSLLSYLRKERSNLLLDETADEDLVLEVKKRLTVMCYQIASAMEYLTLQNFVHRDLATRNCMLDAHFVIKITDFGLTEDVYSRNYFRQGQWLAVKLPVKWMAPESLQDGIFSDKTDVWSFGITCWEIFSGGKTPYPGVDPLSLVQLLENGQRLSKPTNSACPEEIYSIMLKCWNSDPNERPPFSSLVKFISGFAEMTAGYLDISNCNPFGADVVTFTPCEENCDDQTEKKHDPNIGVPLNNPPVIINVQCPSEDGSSEDFFL